MKPFPRKAITWIALGLILTFGITYFDLLASATRQTALFSASLLLYHPSQREQTVTPPPVQTTSPATPTDTPEETTSTLPPSPPQGVETGKVQTTTLALSSANTKAAGVHISNKTGLSVNVQDYLNQGLPFTVKDSTQPQVLIVHTHATESYMEGDYGYYIKSASTRSTDNQNNTVAVGEVLAQTLNDAGIVTINDATQHDYPNYTGSYTRSAQTIKQYLEKYPSIKVVIDAHRDAIAKDNNTKLKPTAEINGKKAAQIMVLAGCEVGSVTNFPNWKENFRFCLQIQKQMEADYEGLARPMSFKACKYNFDLLNGSILVEIGTDANTLEEAKYAAQLLGNVLIRVLS